MSIAIIQDLHTEVRRLFIAGSGLAANDPRLRKLLPQLAKLGESSPVFKRLAEVCTRVVEDSGDKAAVPLLELGSLLHAIMYTQGKNEAAGEAVKVAALSCTAQTTATYRKIAPLLDALTNKGSGRLAPIRSGAADGVFQDFRTFIPAVDALDDVPEIADFIAEQVLPDIGQPIVPILTRSFNPQGGKGDARRLRVLHQLAGGAALPLVEQAATDGAAEPRMAAIGLLSGDPAYVDLLLEQSHDSKKEIRRAAYIALAGSTEERVTARLFKAFTGKDQEAVVEAVRMCGNASLTELVADYTRGQLQELERCQQALDGARGDERTKAEKARDAALTQLENGLEALRSKYDARLLALLCDIQSSATFMAKAGTRLRSVPAIMLLMLQLPEADQFVYGLKDSWSKQLIGYSFIAAARMLSTSELLEQYAADLAKPDLAPAQAIYSVLHSVLPSPESWIHGQNHHLTEQVSRLVPQPAQLAEALSAPEWLELFAANDWELLVAALLPYQPNHRLAIEYTAAKLVERKYAGWSSGSENQLLYALLIVGYERFPEAVMRVMTERPYYQSMDPSFLYLLRVMPQAYAAPITEMSQQWGSYYAEQLQAALEVMKQNEYAVLPAHKGAERIEWLRTR